LCDDIVGKGSVDPQLALLLAKAGRVGEFL